MILVLLLGHLNLEELYKALEFCTMACEEKYIRTLQSGKASETSVLTQRKLQNHLMRRMWMWPTKLDITIPKASCSFKERSISFYLFSNFELFRNGTITNPQYSFVSRFQFGRPKINSSSLSQKWWFITVRTYKKDDRSSTLHTCYIFQDEFIWEIGCFSCFSRRLVLGEMVRNYEARVHIT